MSSGHSFRLFVEQELGKFPHFVIYAILEWTLIALLFLDGFLALVSCEFAELFDLQSPCVLCTRIDHILTRKTGRCSYNDSICEGHKKDLSSLAYCHVHRKLSDIRRMCEGCLLSFATDNKSDGVMNKDIEGLFDEEMRARFKLEPSGNGMVCSCCGEAMKVKSSGYNNNKGNGNTMMNSTTPGYGYASSVPSRLSLAPTPSPRAAFASWKAEEARNTLELTQIRCQELQMSTTTTTTTTPQEEDIGNAAVKEEPKSAPATSLTEPDELIDDALRTPSFVKGNRFFGIPITDSAAASPRWANRMPRKSLLDRVELASDPVEAIAGTETDSEAILNRLKKQVRVDRKSLIALYMELDEERSASAVAANNAMAMITRLQAEKAAVQMEALQYQRMMEEQAEYDQEALQMMKELLAKREDEIKDLESELDLYRDRYGLREITRGDPLEKSQSFSSFTEKSDHGSPLFSIVATDTEMEIHDHISDKSTGSSRDGGEIIGRKDDDEEDDDGYYGYGDHNEDIDDGDGDGGGSLVDIASNEEQIEGKDNMIAKEVLEEDNSL